MEGLDGEEGETGGNWEVCICGERLLLDLGVSEDREINGFPLHTHTKGWINPDDWERGRGSLETLSVWDTFSGAYLEVAQMRKRNQEGPGWLKLNFLI